MIWGWLPAMVINLVKFWNEGIFVLLITGGVLLILAVWLAIEAALAVRRYRSEPPIETLEVRFPDR